MADVDLTPMFWVGLTGSERHTEALSLASQFSEETYTELVAVHRAALNPDGKGYTLLPETLLEDPIAYSELARVEGTSDPKAVAEVEKIRKAAAQIPPIPAPVREPCERPRDAKYCEEQLDAYTKRRIEAAEQSAERARALWLKEVVTCAEGTIFYLDLQLCVLVEPAARPLMGYILVHDSDVYAIDGDWDGSEAAGIMKRAKAVHVVPDRKGVRGAPLSWDALLALLAYETAYLEGGAGAVGLTLLVALSRIVEREGEWGKKARIEAMPRRTSVNHHTTDALTHALTSLTLYGKAQTPEPKAITVAGKTKRNAPAIVNAYLQVIQEMPTSRHLTTLHETVLAAITSLYIEAPYKNILWGDIAYQMGYSDHPREVCKKIAQCCKELADVYTVTDWTGAGRIGSLTDEVRGKRGIMWRLIDVGWVYENGEIIGINLGGRPPANLRFSQQMNNQIDTFPRARLLYGIDTGAGERMTEPTQYIAYKLEDHINTMNRSRKVKAGGTYTVRLIASAKHPERPGLLEEAGVDVTNRNRKKAGVDRVRKVLNRHLAEGTIAGYEIVKEGRKIAAVNIIKKGRKKSRP